MPNITKQLHIDITPEQFLAACSREELQEVDLLLNTYLSQEFKKAQDQLEKALEVRSCHKCGCTDEDCSQCIEKTGSPCHWVAENLCSACVENSTKSKL